MKEYAAYRGEQMVCIGTAKECADMLGIKIGSFLWYATPSAKKRNLKRKNPDKCIEVERLEDDE